jgi:hypothetical protein
VSTGVQRSRMQGRYAAVGGHPVFSKHGVGLFCQIREVTAAVPPQQRLAALENHEPAAEQLKLSERLQSLPPAEVRSWLMSAGGMGLGVRPRAGEAAITLPHGGPLV